MALVVILVLFIVFAPITISIVAIAKANGLKHDVEALRRRLLQHSHAEEQPPVMLQPSGEAFKPTVEPPDPEEVSTPEEPPATPQPATPKPPPPPPVPAKPKVGIEFLMGGRAAAFAGIAILITGIVLLVGYAIQNAWLGAGARVVLGLACGLVLVGIGHGLSRADEKYTLFARVLTGGGSALFYFTVFMAFAFYQLIGAVAAGVGLFICAVAVFGLAMLYHSQSVGVLGVLGAFITPILVGGDLDAGIFPLVYIAVINIPVILLGLRRKWQVLYNLAFVFTAIHFLIWMDRLGTGDLVPGLCFAVLLYLQYAALGLLKLRHEQHISGRTLDLIRLILASLFLLGAVYWMMEESGLGDWNGLAFVLVGLIQFAIAGLAYRNLSRFSGEVTAFVAGGLFAIAMALPVQLDGEWVSLGWGIEGVVVAWMATRVRSRSLQGGAFALGLVGLLKVLVYDVEAYAEPPDLFLNARFGVGLLSAGLVALQGKIASRVPDDNMADSWRDAGWWIGSAGAVLFFFSDIFWTLGTDDPYSWLLTSLVLLASGTMLIFFAPPKSSVVKLGCLLLIAVPAKLLLVDSLLAMEGIDVSLDPFANPIIWIQWAMVASIILLVQPRLAKSGADLMIRTPDLLPRKGRYHWPL